MRPTSNKYLSLILFLIFLLIQPVSWGLCQQLADPSLLSIDRIYASREFAQERFGPARWIEGGSDNRTLERST